MKNKILVTPRKAEVEYRFAPDVRNKISGDWEGMKITNYQVVAEHSASRMKAVIGDQPVLEICTGIGATTFVLARTFPKVFAVDMNESRLHMTKKNLKRLGIAQKVELIQGDIVDPSVLSQLKSKKIGAIYTDVDWKVNNNWEEWVTDIDSTSPSTRELYRVLSNDITPTICMKLPKTINTSQLRELGLCEIEEVKPDGNLSFYLVYFGSLINKKSSEFVFPKYSY